jgi:hypothetical protein
MGTLHPDVVAFHVQEARVNLRRARAAVTEAMVHLDMVDLAREGHPVAGGVTVLEGKKV